MRLRPNMSPSRPARSRNEPNEIRYALTSQVSEVWLNLRSSSMAGNATFTIVPSRMIMSVPTQTVISAAQRRRSSELAERSKRTAGESEGEGVADIDRHCSNDDLGSRNVIK